MINNRDNKNGIDIKNATATPNEVLSGSTFYSGNDKNIQEGEIPLKKSNTYTPGTSNQIITSGQYLEGDQIILGDTDLVAGNIKSGVNIFDVVGTFTSDATTVSGDILSGKTAYANGTKITGNIPVRTSWTYDPEQTDENGTAQIGGNADRLYVRFLPGYYRTSVDSTSGLQRNPYVYVNYPDLAPVIGLTAAKLMKGNTVLGIAGTATSDANATAAQILSGKTAYVNGSKLTGTLTTSSMLKTASGSVTRTRAEGSSLSSYTVSGLTFTPIAIYTSCKYKHQWNDGTWDEKSLYTCVKITSIANLTGSGVGGGTFTSRYGGFTLDYHPCVYPASSKTNAKATWTAIGI